MCPGLLFSFLMYPQAGILYYLSAVLFLSFISTRAAAKTVVLRNQDAGIDYEPSVGSVAGGWERVTDSTDPAGGYMMSTIPGSTATIMCSCKSLLRSLLSMNLLTPNFSY